MDNFEIDVGTGADDEERVQYLEVSVVDDPGEFEGDVRGLFSPEPRTINIDDDGNDTEQIPEKIGELRLLRDELGAGYVTHELFHALCYYMEIYVVREPGLTNEDAEEMLAWELGEWHRQFWNKYREGEN